MKQLIVARFKRWLILCLIGISLIGVGIIPVHSQSSSQLEVFEAVWSTVESNFFDPNFNGVDWSQMRSQYQSQAAQAKSPEQLAAAINQMLGELKTSHTHFYTANEPAYYQIAGIFRRFLLKDLKPFLAEGKLAYPGIGIYTESETLGVLKDTAPRKGDSVRRMLEHACRPRVAARRKGMLQLPFDGASVTSLSGQRACPHVPTRRGLAFPPTNAQEQTFIKAIINGSPAEKAGLKVGDRLLSVAGQPFGGVKSFRELTEVEVPIVIQRTADGATQVIKVTPKTFKPATMFRDAVDSSVEVIERSGQKIGYIHIWSYADRQYQDQLETELFYDRLKDTDGLVWDLRDGWGGASPSYLNIFTASVPTVTSIFRNGAERKQQLQWQKPVVMLVNQGSRSGKEILAYGFRKYNIGQIVGTTTAGAVVAGRPYVMPDGSLLYLAVADVLVDGERLEGSGIIPDVTVALDIPYSQGIDPQKEQAIATVLTAIKGEVTGRKFEVSSNLRPLKILKIQE